ncbi:hypothetical protein M514_02714 [Trichuris suis]|uniref:Uncharacterized protein n=1 Tax=Trichuris suis TaxID=68888 RepID=A0A085MGB3_9BILA|nr:hypothetical protein M513_02714 [Trichuris suis]KFD68816.1 hypothetical protein M514_02714 [Trichuris suis]
MHKTVAPKKCELLLYSRYPYAAKEDLTTGHLHRYMSTYQGVGFSDFADRHSNGWIVGEGMTGHGFIAAMKARTSLVPTRMQTLHGRAEPETSAFYADDAAVLAEPLNP